MKKTTLNPLENARRNAKGGSGAGASDITLSLGTNAGDDPIINLEYQEDGAVLSSPVAFDKEDFYIVNHHMRVEGLKTLKSNVDELSDVYSELDTKVGEITSQLGEIAKLKMLPYSTTTSSAGNYVIPNININVVGATVNEPSLLVLVGTSSEGHQILKFKNPTDLTNASNKEVSGVIFYVDKMGEFF